MSTPKKPTPTLTWPPAPSSGDSIADLFTAASVVRSIGETPELYQRFRETFYRAAPPSNPFESILLEDFIACQWRILRSRRAEAGFLDTVCVETYDKSQTAGPDNVPFSPTYSGWSEEQRGATRLIGNALSKRRARGAVLDLSRYESRLRRAALQALTHMKKWSGNFEPISSANLLETQPETPEEERP